jgi:hypothetical protein
MLYMKVHDITGFPNPVRIRIVLAEKGMDSQVCHGWSRCLPI